jgi:alpha-L-arabinofuranosidase
MKNTLSIACFVLWATCFCLTHAAAQSDGRTGSRTEATVDVSRPGAPIQSTMYGVFFEDINFGADGGLYAEAVKNRSFEFDHPLTGWLAWGPVEIRSDDPAFPNNPHYARLAFHGRVLTGVGLENEGFRGIGFRAGEAYRFSVYARNREDAPARLRVELVSGGAVVAQTVLSVTAKEWTKITAELRPGVTEAKGQLRVNLIDAGTVDLDHISLFPEKTWKGRENGMRADLVQALADLRPGLFRFPGGCIVEGTTLETRYQWKQSVGPVENRPININRWNYTYHRLAHDYYQSYGIGFYDYFLLAEDIGAEPLPVLNAGMACQYENEDSETPHVPLAELGPYVQDALDLIEFANGATTTRWGALRAEMGHPEPFGLKFIAIGNEQWGPMYPARLELFVAAIREKHPEIRIVGSSGPSAAGERFDYLWPEMKRLGVDLVDEHYYMPPQFFYDNADRYDSYDRSGPRVFAGEYAAHLPGRENNFNTALSEAAFMTGLERNADVVHMATYAPLLAHRDAWQWAPDLIWFDNLAVVRTPNYYVQQMYARNAGTHVLPLTVGGAPLTGQDRLYGTAALDGDAGELIIKVVNADNRDRPIAFTLAGLSRGVAARGRATVLHASDLTAENEFDRPEAIAPVEREIPAGDTFEYVARAQSFSVIRIPLGIAN